MSEARFVTEFPLRDPSPSLERIMLGRLEVERFAYNQFVTELNRRDKLMRESVEYRRLSAENRSRKKGPRSSNPVTVSFATKKDRTQAWNALYKRYNLHGGYCLAEYVKTVDAKLKPRTGASALPARLLHEIANRAWQAYEPYRFGRRSGAGRRGYPRRRPYHKPLTTISSRSGEENRGPLKFTSTGISWSNGHRGKSRSVVTLKALIDHDDVVMHHALANSADGEPVHPIRQVRVGYRVIGKKRKKIVVNGGRTVTEFGRRHWFAHLVLEGEAYKKPRNLIADGAVGVDVGSKHIAVVAPWADFAENIPLNPNVEAALRNGKKAERRRARAQDRSKKINNPHVFDEKGTPFKGKSITVRSNRYMALGAERKEINRVLNETKKQQRNALANRIISLGSSVHMEDLTYTGWQRNNMGRSMKASTPGAFTTAVKKAVEKYGREFVPINPYAAKLSQRCHECERCTKTPIRGKIEERISTCPCGRAPVQRDKYSAFLASSCDAGGTLDEAKAREGWTRVSRLLAVGTSNEKTNQ